MEGGRGKERKTEMERKEGGKEEEKKGEGPNGQDTAAASSVQRE